MISVGLAVDMYRASDVQSRMQAALDSAVFAVAKSPDRSAALGHKVYLADLGKTEGRLLAKAANPDITVDQATGTVKGTASASVETTLLGILAKEVVVTAKSAVQVQSTTSRACILALNPTASNAIQMQGTADIVAPDCAVHANSTAAVAVSTSGSAAINAGDICAAGGFQGSGYTPAPRPGCSSLLDPFPGVIEPMVDAAVRPDFSGCNGTAQAAGPNGNVPLVPIRICGTLHVYANTTVTMAPGIYYYMSIDVHSGSVLQGTDVTIILFGPDSWLNIQGGASITLKAPTTGPTAGIVIAQDPRSLRANASQDNTIIGGGLLEPEGMIYLPGRELLVTGAGKIADTVGAFAVVVDHLVMQGNGLLSMRGGANFEGAGFPALSSSAGVTNNRLIQ
jgi:hypothetical protein